MTTRRIQILGAGCAKCDKLAKHAETAAREERLDFTLEKISEIDRILAFDVIQTPALVVDGQVLCSGTVPTVDRIKILLADADGR